MLIETIVGSKQISPSIPSFSHGPGGEHCTRVCGAGKHPTRPHLLKLAEITHIPKKKALEIIETVSQAVSSWPQFAAIAEVSKTSSHLIAKALQGLEIIK